LVHTNGVVGPIASIDAGDAVGVGDRQVGDRVDGVGISGGVVGQVGVDHTGRSGDGGDVDDAAEAPAVPVTEKVTLAAAGQGGMRIPAPCINATVVLPEVGQGGTAGSRTQVTPGHGQVADGRSVKMATIGGRGTAVGHHDRVGGGAAGIDAGDAIGVGDRQVGERC